MKNISVNEKIYTAHFRHVYAKELRSFETFDLTVNEDSKYKVLKHVLY